MYIEGQMVNPLGLYLSQEASLTGGVLPGGWSMPSCYSRNDAVTESVRLEIQTYFFWIWAKTSQELKTKTLPFIS